MSPQGSAHSATLAIDMNDVLSNIESAIMHQKAGDFDTAEALLLDVLSTEPSQAHALLLIGLLYLQMQQPTKAEGYFEKICTQNPQNRESPALRFWFDSLLMQRKFSTACFLLKKYMIQGNELSYFHDKLIRELATLLHQGNIEVALDGAKHFLAMRDLELDALRFRIAYVILTRGFHSEGMELLKPLIKASGAPSEALYFHFAETSLRSPDHSNHFSRLENLQKYNYGVVPDFDYGAVKKVKNKRLRIGFLPLELVDANTLLYIWGGWLGGYEKKDFELFGYIDGDVCFGTVPDFTNVFDRQRQISNLTDEDVLSKVREDRIDILIHLGAIGDRPRARVYAGRAAPIQVEAACVPLGSSEFDYFWFDRSVVPKETFHAYDGAMVLADGPYFCWTAPKRTNTGSELPFDRQGFITFGSLNRFVKVTPICLEVWSDVLASVPNSRLILKGGQFDETLIKKRILSFFSKKNVRSDRLSFLGPTDQVSHLNIYDDIDIALDTVPEQGGCTTLEALFHGVPVINWCYDKRIVSRTGKTIYETLKLEEFSTKSAEEYVNLAKKLSRNPDTLRQLRKKLPAKLESSPLCDAERFSRTVQIGLKKMWELFCDGSRVPIIDLADKSV